MANEGVLRGLSLAMTIQNATGKALKYNPELLNLSMSGSMYMTEGRLRLGGSSSRAYLQNTNNGNLIVDWTLPYTIHVSFVPNGSLGDYQYLIGSSQNWFRGPNITLLGDLSGIFTEVTEDEEHGDDNKVQIRLTDEDGLNLRTGVKCWARTDYDESNLTFTVFDGENTVRSSLPVGYTPITAGDSYALGVCAWFSGRYFPGSFDLTNTYIISNGVPVWGAGY